MYTVAHPSWLHRHPGVITLMHGLLIVAYTGIIDTWLGPRFLFFDDLIVLSVLFTIQWLLLSQRPSLKSWLIAGVITITVWIEFIDNVTRTLITRYIYHPYFAATPNTIMDSRYLLIRYLIVQSVLGASIGMYQYLLLRRAGNRGAGWIVMTTLAYALTTFWWYYHKYFIK